MIKVGELQEAYKENFEKKEYLLIWIWNGKIKALCNNNLSVSKSERKLNMWKKPWLTNSQFEAGNHCCKCCHQSRTQGQRLLDTPQDNLSRPDYCSAQKDVQRCSKRCYSFAFLAVKIGPTKSCQQHHTNWHWSQTLAKSLNLKPSWKNWVHIIKLRFWKKKEGRGGFTWCGIPTILSH